MTEFTANLVGKLDFVRTELDIQRKVVMFFPTKRVCKVAQNGPFWV
jgi:hypothetical protein